MMNIKTVDDSVGVITHGFIDFSQQQMHDLVGAYLSTYIQTIENETLQAAISDESRSVFFSFSWLNGTEETFLQVTLHDRPSDEAGETEEE